MRCFKTKTFARFAASEDIPDSDLRAAAERADGGHAEANYGGDLYKVRIARQGQGKSSGYRTLLCLRRGDKVFFMYGFPKSAKANINDKEERVYKKLGKELLTYTDAQIEILLTNHILFEIML